MDFILGEVKSGVIAHKRELVSKIILLKKKKLRTSLHTHLTENVSDIQNNFNDVKNRYIIPFGPPNHFDFLYSRAIFIPIATVRSNLEWLKDLDTHPLVDSTCPCIHYKTCEWSSELTRLVNPLPKSNPQRRRAVKFMKSVICDKRKRKLRCCAERETIDPPDLSPLPPIGNNTVKISNVHMNKSRWFILVVPFCM